MEKCQEIIYNNIKYNSPKYLKNNRYRIVDILSIGGMGIIYEAIDTFLLNKRVLIKSLIYKSAIFEKKNDVGRDTVIKDNRKCAENEKLSMLYAWEREIGSTPVLLDYFFDYNPLLYGPHNDIDTNESFTLDNYAYNDPYIVINYFPGKTIIDFFSNITDINSRIYLAKKVLIIIIKILKIFHTRYKIINKNNKEMILQFIYCDLKPTNILMTNDKHIVLIDFGSFVKIVNNNVIDKPTTTPGYCAPEIDSKVGTYSFLEISPRVDVYSLAATLYEIITLKKPEIINGQNHFNLDLIQNNKWQTFLEKALNDIPEYRYSDMSEMQSSYYEIVEGKPKKKSGQNMNNYVGRKSNIKKLCKINSKENIEYPDEWIYNANIFKIANLIKFELYYNVVKSFVITANAITALNRIENNYFNLSQVQSNMLPALAKTIFTNSIEILSKNYSFLPELLYYDTTNKDFAIIKSFGGSVFLPPFQSLYNEFYLKKRVHKIIDMFLQLKSMNIIITHISNIDIKFDLSEQPVIMNFLFLITYQKIDFISNPLFQTLILKSYSAPEIINEKKFYDETYSYLIGKLVFAFLLKKHKIDYNKFFQTYPFPSKLLIEETLSQFVVSQDIKTFLINALAIKNSHRSSLIELKSILSNEFFKKKISQKTNNSRRQIIQTNRSPYLLISIDKVSKEHTINYKGIFNDIALANKKFKFYLQHHFFQTPPSQNFINILEKKKSDFSIIQDEEKFKLEFEEVIIREKQNNSEVAFLTDESDIILNEVIIKHIKSFKKVVVFGTYNYYKDYSNTKFYSISYYCNKRFRQ